jgi:hypothetical protein
MPVDPQILMDIHRDSHTKPLRRVGAVGQSVVRISPEQAQIEAQRLGRGDGDE